MKSYFSEVDKAFGDRIATFESYRKRFDPTGRLLNDYFRKLLAVKDTVLDTPSYNEFIHPTQ